jgi:hypothetical protein
MRLEDGTMVCDFDLKKSRNDCRICELVIIFETRKKSSEKPARGRAEVFCRPAQNHHSQFVNRRRQNIFKNNA